jgi:hypothetical protein
MGGGGGGKVREIPQFIYAHAALGQVHLGEKDVEEWDDNGLAFRGCQGLNLQKVSSCRAEDVQHPADRGMLWARDHGEADEIIHKILARLGRRQFLGICQEVGPKPLFCGGSVGEKL